MSPQDAVDAIAPPDAPVDLGGGGPDTGIVDRPAIDVPDRRSGVQRRTRCATPARSRSPCPAADSPAPPRAARPTTDPAAATRRRRRSFKLVLTQKSDVFVTTHGTAFDTVIYLRNGCCGTEIACNDDADNRKTSVLTSRGLAAGHVLHLRRRRQRRRQRRLHRRHLRDADDDQRDRQLRQPRAHRQPAGHGHHLRHERRLHAEHGVPGRAADHLGRRGLLLRARRELDGGHVQHLHQHLHRHRALRARRVHDDVDPDQKSCNDNFCAPRLGSMCRAGDPGAEPHRRDAGPRRALPGRRQPQRRPATSCGSFTVTPTGVPQ